MGNSQKSVKNISISIATKLLTALLGVIIPRFFLLKLGSEANGLLSSISQVLIYLNLLEAGVGAASIQALYLPISKKDKNRTNEILAATGKFYQKTGLIYFVIVFLIAIIFPLAVNSEIPRFTITLVVLLNGIPSALSYFFQGKYKVLLQVEGKNYVTISLTSVSSILTSILKIVLLYLGFGLIALQVMSFLINIFQMLFILLYIRKHYKWLNLSVDPDFSAISQKTGALFHQISSMIFSNTDVIILTYFCGLKQVSVYVMYQTLFNVLNQFVNSMNEVSFALGQLFHNDFKEFKRKNDIFETAYITVTFYLFSIATIFIIPFLKIYTRGVNDINYIDNMIAYLFASTYLLSNSRIAAGNIAFYAGHIEKTKYRALAEAIINIAVSLICAPFLKIHGVLIGTLVALLYRTNDMILYASRQIMQRSPFITYRRILINLIVFIALVFAGKTVFSTYIIPGSYIEVFGCAIICLIVFFPLYLIPMCIVERQVYKDTKTIINNFLKKKLKGKKYER